MRNKNKFLLLLSSICILICACTINKNEVGIMKKNEIRFIDIWDYAPRATEIHPLNKVDKIMIRAGSSLRVGVDIKNKWMSTGPLNLIDSRGAEYNLDNKEIRELFRIFEKYKVQSWNTEYKEPAGMGYEYETDQYVMNIFLLYQNGTVEEHKIYTSRREYAPPNYYEFLDELKDWVYKRIPRVKPGEN